MQQLRTKRKLSNSGGSDGFGCINMGRVSDNRSAKVMSDLRRSAVFVWRTTELNRRSAVELNEQIIAELRALVERLTGGSPSRLRCSALRCCSAYVPAARCS